MKRERERAGERERIVKDRKRVGMDSRRVGMVTQSHRQFSHLYITYHRKIVLEKEKL
jgi:ABC-type sulfate/molybdate transport systems ATPase subunit